MPDGKRWKVLLVYLMRMTMMDGANSSSENPLALNLCDIPAWRIGSYEFNVAPTQLSLAGVRQSNRRLFEQLDCVDSKDLRGKMFHDYLTVRHQLHHFSAYEGVARSSLRNSYIRFLRGWEVDSNGIEGAVLKSWAQSRFGITPTYHRGLLGVGDSYENSRFAHDRMKGSLKTNAIFSQLDLLFEFCQYELHRRYPSRLSLVLYRGTNDPDEHPVYDKVGARNAYVRLNNIVSFTSDREKAWEFGSTVWRTVVAATKIVFFSGLLPDSLLYGEEEYLVIGGDYYVEELRY